MVGRNQVAARLDVQLQLETIQRMVEDAVAEHHQLLLRIHALTRCGGESLIFIETRTKTRPQPEFRCNVASMRVEYTVNPLVVDPPLLVEPPEDPRGLLIL
jgi:hypothetical protein